MNINDIIRKSSNFDTLQKLVMNETSCKSKDAIQIIYEEWIKANYESIETIERDAYVTPVELNSKMVSSLGKTYILHGVVHSTPSRAISSDIIRYVRQNVDNYIRQNAPIMVEDKLTQMFHLNNVIDMIVLPEVRRRLGLDYYFIIMKELYHHALAGRSLINTQSSDVELKLFKEVLKGVKDKRCWSKVQSIYALSCLPEPLDMEAKFNTDQKFYVLMSQAMANKLREYVITSNSKAVHSITGIIHVPQIKYFLEHPNFSLS